ncbi:unnamed protein product [Prorocentrum cordatum]|uniref:Uncharacterized protein n=1 Tax=Prorocentrum cordatum TaxID=2364126 RepID=A0ABN9WLT4_9DINO|nr:unnamed protein product [Polarella glacialis]
MWVLFGGGPGLQKVARSPAEDSLEALGCQVKGYKTHKNAARALDKKRTLPRSMVLVSGLEASHFLNYVASRPEFGATKGKGTTSLAWEAGFGGLPLLAAELARWALGVLAGWRPRPFLMFSVCDEISTEYGEPPPRLAHMRVAVVGVSIAHPEHFSVFTTDFDVHLPGCDARNDDIKNSWMHWAAGAPLGAAVCPAGVQCYDFAAAPTAAQVAGACFLAAGRLAAHGRALGPLGVGAGCGPGPGAAPSVAIVAAALGAGWPFGGGFAAGAPAAMAVAAAGGAAFAVPTAAPAAGAGPRALAARAELVGVPEAVAPALPAAAGPAGGAAAGPAAAGGGGGGDLRTLATARDSLGQRHREFRDSVQLRWPTCVPDRPGPGPATYHWVATCQAKNGADITPRIALSDTAPVARCDLVSWPPGGSAPVADESAQLEAGRLWLQDEKAHDGAPVRKSELLLPERAISPVGWSPRTGAGPPEVDPNLLVGHGWAVAHSPPWREACDICRAEGLALGSALLRQLRVSDPFGWRVVCPLAIGVGRGRSAQRSVLPKDHREICALSLACRLRANAGRVPGASSSNGPSRGLPCTERAGPDVAAGLGDRLPHQALQPSVGVGTLLDYRRRVDSFVMCCSELLLDWSSWAQLDVAVVACVDYLHFHGYSEDDASPLLGALKSFLPPICRWGDLALFWASSSLAGWGKRAPQRMRMPIPWLAVAAMPGVRPTQWQFEQTIAMILGVAGYLRSSERDLLTAMPVAPPGWGAAGASGVAALVLRPNELGHLGRTGLRDFTVGACVDCGRPLGERLPAAVLNGAAAAVDIGSAKLRFALGLVSLRRSTGVPVYLENPRLS